MKDNTNPTSAEGAQGPARGPLHAARDIPTVPDLQLHLTEEDFLDPPKAPADPECPEEIAPAPATEEPLVEMPVIDESLVNEPTAEGEALPVTEPEIASAVSEDAVATEEPEGEADAPQEASDNESEAPAEVEDEPETPAMASETDEEAFPEEEPHRILTVAPIRLPESLRAERTVNSMMTDVLVALLPLLIWAVYLFGLRPLTVAAVAVLSAYVVELLSRLIFRRWMPMDLSPAVTGLILALGMPPTVPLWLPALGSFIAVFFIRQLFGGTGRNRLNPAATALAILSIVFPAMMTTFCPTGVRLSPFSLTVSSFEPVEGTVLETLLSGTMPSESLGQLFFGLNTGLIGEMSAFLLLAGGIYLTARRVIRPGLPVAFLVTVAGLTYFFPTLAAASDAVAIRYALYHLLSGNLLLCAFFMITDPVTSPRSDRASILAGVIGGAVTVAIRYYVHPHIGVICAVLIVNLLSRPLDILLRPSVFGGRPKEKKSA